jgi:hypothetical protein
MLMRFSRFGFWCLIVGISLIASGCTVPRVPIEELKNYALLVPRNIYGNGAAVTSIDRGPARAKMLFSHEGSNLLPGVQTVPGVDVLPGHHTVVVTTCNTGSSSSCWDYSYDIEAEAGLAYVLMGPKENIVVVDRFTKTVKGYLHLNANHEYVNDQEFSAIRQREQANAENERIATLEQRKRDQVMIRKLGAQVCQENERGTVYVGYVEKIAEEKVQIRIVDAHFKGSPGTHVGGFSSSVIWDSPMQWDLCR